MDIRFGLQIPSFSFAGAAERNLFEVTREIVEHAEGQGIDSIWLMDHLFQIPVVAPETDPILDCWAGLAALAACTQRVRLGTLVAAAGFRTPSVLAKTTSTIDVISGGRLIVGLGAGWCDWEHRAYGLPFPPIGERMARLEEAIEVLKAMWTQERASFAGRYHTIDGAVCAPKPVQRPHPPILIGGSGEKVTLRLTAQHAGLHNLGAGGPEECRHVLGVLREHCDREDTDYAAIEKTRLTPILFADSESDADRRVQELCPEGESPKGFRARTLMGTPEAIVEQLGAFVDAGVETFIVSFWDVEERAPIDVLMKQVAPSF